MAVGVEPDRLTIEHEGRRPERGRGPADQRVSIQPVMPSTREQPDTVAIAFKAEAVAFVFDRKSSRLCP